MTKEQRELAQTISVANGGQVMFNFTKAAKIAGRCRTTFPAWLQECGVLVQATGKDKRVNVNDLAVAMTFGRQAPIHKTVDKARSDAVKYA